MKAVLFLATILILTQSAFAAQSCPNLSGKYKDDTGHVFVIKQEPCLLINYFQNELEADQNDATLELKVDGIDYSTPFGLTNSTWTGTTLNYRDTSWFDIGNGRAKDNYITGQLRLNGKTLTWSGKEISMGQVVQDFSGQYLKIK